MGAGKRKGRVDAARAKALREAGWTYEKIGKEFGVGGQTVINALKRATALELTEKEKAACDQLAAELFGGDK